MKITIAAVILAAAATFGIQATPANACTTQGSGRYAVTYPGPCSGGHTSQQQARRGSHDYQSYGVVGHKGRVDENGNPVIDPATGKQYQDSVRGWTTRHGAPDAPTFNPGAAKDSK